MSERRKVLDLFEQQKEYADRRIAEGIEKHRKGDVELTIIAKDGTPVSDIKVQAVQQTHEFRFGANLFMLDELETDAKNELYKKYFTDIFNIATLPFYWDTLEPEKGKPRYEKTSPKIYRRPTPDLCIEFCEKNGIEPREHALAYDAFFPQWLYGVDVCEVKAALEKRFYEISQRYADKIPTIEVTNEMEWEQGKTKFYDELDYVEWCFKVAEKYFPNNQLCINERPDLCWADRCRATDKYYAYIESNLLKGARIDAIGMQYHLFNAREDEYEKTRFTLNPENLYRHMDMYSNFGKPLHITEITVPAYSWDEEDEQIQAEIIEKVYSIWFSHPNVEQIIYWNFVDGYAHLWDSNPDNIKASQGNMSIGENYFHGGLLRFDLSPKPAYCKLKHLIQHKWNTNISLVADKWGKCSFRGFYGKYELEIYHNGHSIKRIVDVSSKSQNKIKIIL